MGADSNKYVVSDQYEAIQNLAVRTVNRNISLFVCGSPDDDLLFERTDDDMDIEREMNMEFEVYHTFNNLYQQGFRIFHIYDNCAFTRVCADVLTVMHETTHKGITLLVILSNEVNNITDILRYSRLMCSGIVNLRNGKLNAVIGANAD